MRDSIAPSIATLSGAEQSVDEVCAKMGYHKLGQAGGYSAEAGADRFHGKLEQDDGSGAQQESDDSAGNAIGQGATEDHHQHRARSERRRGVGKCVEAAG
jgi:hypothetical protein